MEQSQIQLKTMKETEQGRKNRRNRRDLILTKAPMSEPNAESARIPNKFYKAKVLAQRPETLQRHSEATKQSSPVNKEQPHESDTPNTKTRQDSLVDLTPQEPANSETFTTRSGRTVKSPKYLKDYVHE
ncbi:predicted protein [Nematostella vectensis]|nr:predicted protein [Nematostella vectensis]|eukprot:XP_001623207.1 predicted protein [Nematostella vectensis]